MRKLVDEVRKVVEAGPVDRRAITRLELVVRDAVPRLQETRLCTEPLKPGRYLCYRDADHGFVVMVLVWGPGDGTAIHDHGTWGVEAVLRNSLKVIQYSACETKPVPLGEQVLGVGAILHNLPPDRDVHKVEHYAGDYALSLHVYGKDMTANRQFVPGEGYKHCSLNCRELTGIFELTRPA